MMYNAFNAGRVGGVADEADDAEVLDGLDESRLDLVRAAVLHDLELGEELAHVDGDGVRLADEPPDDGDVAVGTCSELGERVPLQATWEQLQIATDQTPIARAASPCRTC